MKTKETKELINILQTEIKINEIDKSFLSSVPKRPEPVEKLRPKQIILPIAIGSILASLLITLMIFTINNPLFTNPQEVSDLTDTKKIMTFQVVGCITLIEDLYNVEPLTNARNTKVKEEVESYLNLAEKYLNKKDLKIEALPSNDEDYQNMYKISLDKDVYFYFNEIANTDGDIDEVSSELTGYILVGDNKYQVEGYKVVENEEVNTVLRTYYKDNYFVEVKQEIEAGENEYTFTYFEDQKIVNELKLELEEHISYQEIDIEDTNNTLEFVLQKDKILVDVKIPGLYDGDVIIYIEEDNYIYNFQD